MWKHYWRNESGQFAIMFAVILTLLVGALGAAIDVSAVYSARQHNQMLSDAAVLAAAISGEQKKKDLEEIAELSVASMTNGSEDYEVDLTILPNNSLHVEVTKPYHGYLLSAFSPISVTAKSEAPPKGMNKLNVALVLDVTDSMEGDKIEALKDAAEELIEVFESDDDDESSPSVMFSVVPFARYVRVPMTMGSETWLDVEPDNLNCWDRLDLDASEDAGVCTPSDEEGEDYSCTNPVYYEHCEVLSWNGCLASRVEPWHERSYVGAVNFSGFAGGGGCGPEILPLTGDLEEVEDSIDDLYTYDETYIPSGLMWGWRTLTPEAPLTEANTADYEDRHSALILMTDGENSRSYGGVKDNGFEGVFHWEHDMDDANDLTADTCADIKLDGIEIYTVAFEVEDTDTHNLLRSCASHPSKYFDASNAALLETAFESIGQELAQVRISR